VAAQRGRSHAAILDTQLQLIQFDKYLPSEIKKLDNFNCFSKKVVSFVE
jgi:hypothetical protein